LQFQRLLGVGAIGYFVYRAGFINSLTGKPKNDGWKKYFEFTHTGQGEEYNIPHTWGGAKSTWRNDQLTSIDVAYMNHREIIALK
jgi:hypothetical protein